MSFALIKYQGYPNIYVRPIACISKYLDQGKAVVKSDGATYIANILGYFASVEEAESVKKDLQKTLVVKIANVSNIADPTQSDTDIQSANGNGQHLPQKNILNIADAVPPVNRKVQNNNGNCQQLLLENLLNTGDPALSVDAENLFPRGNNQQLVLEAGDFLLHNSNIQDTLPKDYPAPTVNTEDKNDNGNRQPLVLENILNIGDPSLSLNAENLMPRENNQQLLLEAGDFLLHNSNIQDTLSNDTIQNTKCVNDLCDISQPNANGLQNVNEVIIEEIPYNESMAYNFHNIADISDLEASQQFTSSPPSHKYTSKKHCCVFCHKLVTKIARHLISVHCNENDIKQLSVYPINSQERLGIINKLRKRGDFYYNQELLKLEEPTIPITTRRTQKNKASQPGNFVPCPNCLGTYSKTAFRFHARKCIPNLEKNPRNLQRRSRQTLNHVHKRASEELRNKVLPPLRSDVIGETVRRDELIVVFGNNLIRKYRAPHQAEMIRARLRLLARFVLAMRQLDSNITDLISTLQLKHLDHILVAVEQIGQIEESGLIYRTPTSAFVLSGYLKHAAKLQSMDYSINDEEEKAKKIDTLIKFLEESFNSEINPTITETQNEMARKKIVKLPSTDSIKIYIEHNERKIRHFMNEINNKGFMKNRWLQLASHTLTALQAFNRKRPGEVQRILIEDFLAYQTINEKKDKELYKSFSVEEKEQAYKYVRIELRGKKGQNTALLLNQIHLAATLLLLKERPQMNISPKNKFLFGIPSSTNNFATLDAYKIMKSCSQECGLKEHQLIRGNTLRKHVATTVSLNKDRNTFSKERLSDFMSHSLEIHKNIYEVGSPAIDITHVSKMLEEALESKQCSTLNSKDLPLNYNLNKSNTSISLKSRQPSTLHTRQTELTKRTEVIPKRNMPAKTLTLNHSSTFSEVDEKSDSDFDIYQHRSSSSASSKNSTRITTPIMAEGKARRRRAWTTPERSLTKEAFHSHINSGTIPSSLECKRLMQQHIDVFANSNVQRIKTWVGHQYKLLFNPGRRSWNTPEKSLVKSAFSDHLEKKSIPSEAECARLKTQHRRVLAKRSPVCIRSFVANEVKRRARSY